MGTSIFCQSSMLDYDYPFHRTVENQSPPPKLKADSSEIVRTFAFTPAILPPSGLNRHYNAQTLPGEKSSGFPGLMNLQTGSSLDKPSYDTTLLRQECAVSREVTFIINPDLDITIISMDLCPRSTLLEFKEKDQVVDLKFPKPTENVVEVLKGALSVNVRLEFFIGKDVAQRCIIDSAALFDPNQNTGQGPRDGDPKTVCYLGMDWLNKYPYILLAPKWDKTGRLDFTINASEAAARPNTLTIDRNKQLTIHIEGTVNGLGVFFAPGSIYNTFGRVASSHDNDGTEFQKERAVLMGVLKALQIAENLRAHGHQFDGVSIRSTDANVVGLLDPANGCVTPTVSCSMYEVAGFHMDLWRTFTAAFGPEKMKALNISYVYMRDGAYYPDVRAAARLAKLGAEMTQFRTTTDRAETKLVQRFGDKLADDTKPRCLQQSADSTLPLLDESEHAETPVFTVLTLGGSFYVKQESALEALAESDKLGHKPAEIEITNRLGYVPWEGEVAVSPSGFLDYKLYKYVAFPRTLPTDPQVISDSPVFDVFMKAVKLNSRTAMRNFQAIIWGPNSMEYLKPLAFLSTAGKKYRDELLKVFFEQGLDEGWHFCRDYKCDGYLRNNANVGDIYEDLKGEKMGPRGGGNKDGVRKKPGWENGDEGNSTKKRKSTPTPRLRKGKEVEGRSPAKRRKAAV